MADYSAPQQGGGILPQSMSDLASGLIDPSLTGGQSVKSGLRYAGPARKSYALSTALTQPSRSKMDGGHSFHGECVDRRVLWRAGGQDGTGRDVSRPAAPANHQSGLGRERRIRAFWGNLRPAPYGGLPSDPTSSGGVPSPGGAASGAPPDGSAFPNTQAGHEAFIRSYAASKGVNPDFAAAVAGSEGLRALSPQNPNSASTVDREKDGARFRSAISS